MIPGFQCFYDKQGDLHFADGVVIGKPSGVVKLVGSGGEFSETFPDAKNSNYTAARSAVGSSFVGGSGRNVYCEGLAPRTSGAPVPAGFFRPTVPNSFELEDFVLVVTGGSAASISDGTDVIAILSTGGTAPVGSYASTAYGEATYGLLVLGVGQPFTLTVSAEDALGGDIPACVVSVSAGTAQAGQYTPTDAANFTSDDDSNFTLVLDPSGSADLLFHSTVIATRASGTGHNPDGEYAATAAGMAAFNLTAAEPVLGEPWQAQVAVVGRVPRVGFGYLEIVEVGGVLSAVNGPFFATAMPAAFDETYYFPLAHCDGYAVEQYHAGPLIWSQTLSIPEGTPASATAPGWAGQILRDADYTYICIATDTWHRQPHATWP